jgi:hypothetical protein
VSLLSQRRGRLSANPANAIYGTILATALIVVASGHETDPGRVALVVSVSLLVFWLAHAYTRVLEHGLRHRVLQFAVVRTTLAEEFAMVEGPALSIVFLVAGARGWIDPGLSVTLALANGVCQLTVWGVALARGLGRSWPVALLVGLVNTGFGLLMVGLKVLVH